MDTMTLWQISWAIGAVVVLIVAVLLILIVLTARKIDKHAEAIWQAGKEIAANTVSIWMLQKTNGVAAEILDEARQISAATKGIESALSGLAGGGGTGG